jgi:hypothetical protein
MGNLIKTDALPRLNIPFRHRGDAMIRYQHREIEAILKLFERELSTLNRLGKFEKMKIRKRVANSILPALNMSRSEPDVFLNIIENKLNDVFNMFFDSWGFRERLHSLVEKINKNKKELKKKQSAVSQS